MRRDYHITITDDEGTLIDEGKFIVVDDFDELEKTDLDGDWWAAERKEIMSGWPDDDGVDHEPEAVAHDVFSKLD